MFLGFVCVCVFEFNHSGVFERRAVFLVKEQHEHDLPRHDEQCYPNTGNLWDVERRPRLEGKKSIQEGETLALCNSLLHPVSKREPPEVFQVKTVMAHSVV